MTSESSEQQQVLSAFLDEQVVLTLDQIVPLKVLRPGALGGKKYHQVLSSIHTVGLVEAPVVVPNSDQPGSYFLLDGHLRLAALKELGVREVSCLVSTDDEGYTYNKRVNRLAVIQEHKMIARAIERGVPEERIAEALGINVSRIRQRFRMLDGICPEVVEMLKDSPCPIGALDGLRVMLPPRQMEAAELMLGQGNYSAVFVQALLAATPENQRVEQKRKRFRATAAMSEQIARMERELVGLQRQVKIVEDNYGLDNLHLTVAKGYVSKLLGNPRIVRWLSQYRQEYLLEFQNIADIQKIASSI